jgi:hypothetical protein
MSLTYHYYSASIIHAPINQLHCDMHSILSMQPDLIHAGVSAAPRWFSTQLGTTVALEEASDRVAGTCTLTYRPTACAPEIAEYIATCTLQRVADAPHTTFVEWMRAYRPAASASHDQIDPFVSALLDQDQAIAAQLGAVYGSTEVFSIDYTLGGAA